MKVYLDNCSLQRPLDTKSQPRILLEAEAILMFMDFSVSDQVEVISSEVLEFEVNRNPHATRKEFATEFLSRSSLRVKTNERVIENAQGLIAAGIKPLDALHLASAIEAEADYFCTCDDRFLKKAREMTPSSLKVVTPLELIMEIEK